MNDTSKLSAPIMAQEMFDALQRRGVQVGLGASGWRKLLEGIAEGIIIHLAEHEAAFVIPAITEGTFEHDHGHVDVNR
jgi:hypothetical protein